MSSARVFHVETAEFVVRTVFAAPQTRVVSPADAPALAVAFATSLRQFGLTLGQVRFENSSTFLADRSIEAWLGTRGARARLTIEGVEVTVLEGRPRGWAFGIPVFEALLTGLMGSLPELAVGPVTTSWNCHLAPAEPLNLTAPLPSVVVQATPILGPMLSVGYALNFGQAPWDAGIESTTILAEGSSQVPNGVYLSIRNAWRLTAHEQLVQRFSRHAEQCTSALGIVLDEKS